MMKDLSGDCKHCQSISIQFAVFFEFAYFHVLRMN